jgi:hypothetical protein
VVVGIRSYVKYRSERQVVSAHQFSLSDANSTPDLYASGNLGIAPHSSPFVTVDPSDVVVVIYKSYLALGLSLFCWYMHRRSVPRPSKLSTWVKGLIIVLIIVIEDADRQFTPCRATNDSNGKTVTGAFYFMPSWYAFINNLSHRSHFSVYQLIPVWIWQPTIAIHSTYSRARNRRSISRLAPIINWLTPSLEKSCPIFAWPMSWYYVVLT